MSREDKEALAAEHASAVLDLQQRMAAAAEEAEARYTELHQQYAAIKARYDAREPREEDVLRIRQVWSGAGQGESWRKHRQGRLSGCKDAPASALKWEDNDTGC